MDRHKKMFYALCIGFILSVIVYVNAWIKLQETMAALDIYMEGHQETLEYSAHYYMQAVDADGSGKEVEK